MAVGTRRRDGKHSKAASLDRVERAIARLARLLIQERIASPEAEGWLRAASVHEAARARGVGGKKLNASWIAFITGVPRKEVARTLKAREMAGPSLQAGRHPANRVLEAWYSDPNYVKKDEPLVLPLRSSQCARPSFWALATQYAPDVYPGLVLRELSRAGSLVKLADGRVRIRARRYSPSR